MRTFIRARVAPFIAIFIAYALVNGIAGATLFSRGFGFMLGPVGTALGAVFTLAVAASTTVVLSRMKGITPRDAGFHFDAGFVRELFAATVGGALSVVAIVGALTLMGAASLTWNGLPSWAFGVGLVAFWINAGLQQIGMQGLWLALRRGERSTWTEALLPLALFIGSHLMISHAPIYVLNVALFAVATMLLFTRKTPPSYAGPVGLHGGWNAAMLFFGTFPENPNLSAFAWTPRGAAWLTGGAAGIESGALYALVIAAVGAGLYALRQRR